MLTPWLGRGDISPQARLLLAGIALHRGVASYRDLKILIALPDRTFRRALEELVDNACVSVTAPAPGGGTMFRLLPYQPAPRMRQPLPRSAPAAKVSEGMKRL